MEHLRGNRQVWGEESSLTEQERVAAVETLVAEVPVILPMSLDKFYKTTDTLHRTCGEIGLKPLLFIYLFFNTFQLFSSLTGNTVFV